MTRSKFVRAARARPAHASTTISGVRNSIEANKGSALTSGRDVGEGTRSRGTFRFKYTGGGRPMLLLGTRGPIGALSPLRTGGRNTRTRRNRDERTL